MTSLTVNRATRLPHWLRLALACALASRIMPYQCRAAANVPATSGPAAVSSATDEDAPEPPDVYGIGVLYTPDGDYPEVIEIADGGAAEKDGRLKVGDHLTGLAEGDAPFFDCKGVDLPKITPMTRGKEGSVIRIRVIPASDPSKVEVIALHRAELYVTRLLPAEKVRLAGDVGKIAKAQRESIAADMQKTLELVVQATGLEVSGSSALEGAATAAVNQCIQDATGQIGKLLKKDLLEYPGREQRRALFDQIDSNPEAEAKRIEANESTSPDQEPAWQKALKQVLTPSQAAAWQEAQAGQRQNVQNLINGDLAQMAALATEEEWRVLNPEIGAVEAKLDLPREREEKLEELEKSVAADFGAGVRASAEKQVQAMTESQRKNLVAANGFQFIGQMPRVTTAEWDASLAKFLTADEMKRLKDGEKVHAGLRAAAHGKLLVALMDEKMALTTAQRAQLEPMAQSLMQSQSSFIGDRLGNNYFAFMPARYYSVAAAAPQDPIKAILDPIQWGHWEELKKLKDQNDESNDEGSLQLPSATSAQNPEPAAEPGEVERAISQYMMVISGSERESVVAERVLEAEDIARIDHLTGDAAVRLQTAARGQADEYLLAWNDSAEQMLRSNLKDVSPDTIRAQLANIQTYQFQNVSQQLSSGTTRQVSIWDRAVKAELSRDQLKAWQQETSARSAYREAAIAGYLVSMFDEEFGLAPGKWSQLEWAIAKVIHVYGVDFKNFSSSAGAWFLQSNYMFLPMAGIPDADMKGILSAGEWDRWRTSNEHLNAAENWPYLLQLHQQAANAAKGTL